jgi:hypothetical protein
MGCAQISQNPQTGIACGSTHPIGLILWNADPGLLDMDSLKSLSFWDAQAKLDKPNRAYFIYKFDQADMNDPEPQTQDLNIAGTIKTGRTAETDDFLFLAGDCGLQSVYGGLKGGSQMWILRLMSDGTIRGKELISEAGVNNKLQAVEAYITSDYVQGKPDAIEQVIIRVTQTEDYMEYKSDAEVDFTFAELEGVTSIAFVNVATNDATTTVFDAIDCNKADVDDLTVGASGTHMFLAYDKTAGASLVITTVAKSGNTYTLTFGAGIKVSTNEVQYTYEEPSTSGQLYSTPKTLTLTNP